MQNLTRCHLSASFMAKHKHHQSLPHIFVGNFSLFLIACVDLHTQSFASSCEYEVIEPDTSFLNGYQSLINTWKDNLAKKNIQILTNTVVNKIKWQNSNGKVVVATEDGRSFVADYVIVTVSLGNFTFPNYQNNMLRLLLQCKDIFFN